MLGVFSIVCFEVGRDPDTPQDNHGVHDQPGQQPPHYPHVKPPFTHGDSLKLSHFKAILCACIARASTEIGKAARKSRR